MNVTDDPIVVTQTCAAPPEAVWEALTVPEKMSPWFFPQIAAFEPRVGFETTFVVENEGRVFPHHWVVTAVEPERSITYDWDYGADWRGRMRTRFDVTPCEGGAQVAVTCTILEDFTPGVPEFSRAACRGGWDHFIGERIKAYVESGSAR